MNRFSLLILFASITIVGNAQNFTQGSRQSQHNQTVIAGHRGDVNNNTQKNVVAGHRGDANDTYHNVGMPQHAHTPHIEMPATQEQVANIVQLLKNTSFDDKRLAVAKVCLSLRPILAADLSLIIKTFSFENTRLAFAKYAYQFCPDKEHFYFEISPTMSFRSSEKELLEYIKKIEYQRPR